MSSKSVILQAIEEHAALLKQMVSLEHTASEMAKLCIDSLKNGNKILICGNGGSAADAQHIAAELIGRYHTERRSLPAIALTTDTSILTAVSNDYAYDQVFRRQIEGLGCPGDVFWGISTSGNSESITLAAEEAKKKGLYTMASTGKTGGRLAGIVDVFLLIPSNTTARIQEMHMLVAHAICEAIDTLDWSNFEK